MKKDISPTHIEPVENLPTEPLVLSPSQDSMSVLHFHGEDSDVVRVTRTIPSPAKAFWRFHALGKGTFNIRSHPLDNLFWTWDENRLVLRRYTGNPNQDWEIFHERGTFFYIRRPSAPENNGFVSVNLRFIEDEPVTFASLGSMGTIRYWLGKGH